MRSGSGSVFSQYSSCFTALGQHCYTDYQHVPLAHAAALLHLSTCRSNRAPHSCSPALQLTWLAEGSCRKVGMLQPHLCQCSEECPGKPQVTSGEGGSGHRTFDTEKTAAKCRPRPVGLGEQDDVDGVPSPPDRED